MVKGSIFIKAVEWPGGNATEGGTPRAEVSAIFTGEHVNFHGALADALEKAQKFVNGLELGETVVKVAGNA